MIAFNNSDPLIRLDSDSDSCDPLIPALIRC